MHTSSHMIAVCSEGHDTPLESLQLKPVATAASTKVTAVAVKVTKEVEHVDPWGAREVIGMVADAATRVRQQRWQQ